MNFFIERFYNFFFKPKKVSDNNVIHLTRFFGKEHYGGIEETILQFAKHSNFNHIVLSTISHCEKKERVFDNLISKQFKITLNIFNDVFSFSLLKYLIKNEKNYSTIIIHYPHIFGLFYLLLLPFRKKVIVIYHSDILKFKILKIFIDKLFSFFDRIIDNYYISSKIYFENSSIKRYKSKTIIEPFSIKSEKKIENTHLKKLNYVLFISRFRHYKGLDILEKIVERCQNLHFKCVTDYNFKRIHDNIEIYKNIDKKQKIELLSNSKVVISTSTNRAESFGLSMLEGLMFEKPLMCFNLNTGINDIVLNHKNGFIISKFDIDDYIKKLNELYNNDALYNKFCDYSQKHKKLFNSNFRKLEDLI